MGRALPDGPPLYSRRRGASSIGRAMPLQGIGYRFEPGALHWGCGLRPRRMRGLRPRRVRGLRPRECGWLGCSKVAREDGRMAGGAHVV